MLEELERLRAYRADLPEPDEPTVAAARALLMEAIGHEPRATASAARGNGPSRRRLRRLQRRRRFVLAGGLATVGVGIAGGLGLTTAATPVSALAAQMNQLAKVAASQDWTGIPGPGQYLYTASDGLTTSATAGANNEMCSVSQVEHRRVWIATDGSGALNDTRAQSRFTSPADQATCAAMGITNPASQNSSWTARFPAGGLSFPANDWKSFSTDPATLLKQVHQRDGGPDTPAEWFTNIADMMRESDVPPAIRAALYKAAALIPGVKLLGAQTDPTGQTGLGVGFPDAGGQIHAELIFDQGTGRLLAEEYYDQTGKLVEWYSYTDQRIVDVVPGYPMERSRAAASPGPATPPQKPTAGGAVSTPAQSSTTAAATTPGTTTTGATAG